MSETLTHCTNGHEIPPKGPGQHTNGRTVCRPCEDAGTRYQVVWSRKVTTSPGPCVSPAGGRDLPEHRYVPGHVGGRAACIGCGRIEPDNAERIARGGGE